MAGLRAHPFFASIHWQTLWTDPAPPLEAGLVRREPPKHGADQKWEDVGAAWDDLVNGQTMQDGADGDEDDFLVPAGKVGWDGIGWAADAEGPEYELFGKREYEAVNVPPEDVGPLGELPSYAHKPAELGARDLPSPDGASERTMLGALTPMSNGHVNGVNGNGFGSVNGNGFGSVNGNGFGSVNGNGFGSVNGTALYELPEPEPSEEDTHQKGGSSESDAGETVHGPVKSDAPEVNGKAHDPPAKAGSKPVDMPAPVRDAYATSSSDGSPVEKLGAALEAMGLNRGRNRTRSPIRNELPAEPDW